MKVNVENLSFCYENQPILAGIDLDIKEKAFVGIIGPNGSGKSTLLKNIYRALRPDQGVILLDNKNIESMSFKESSQRMAVVTQEMDISFDFTVEDMVRMGRTPYKRLFESDTIDDENHVLQSLEQVGMLAYRNRNFSQLSGGEKQRVLLARALCQDTRLVLLDEPTNHLDIYYQLQLFDLISQLDITVVAAIHDLNIACMYCDTLYVLKDGQIYAKGTTEEIMTSQLIKNVFSVDSLVEKHPVTNKLHISFIPKKLGGRIDEE